MPQLDPNTFSPQIVWLTISFIVLYLVMARVALPRIAEVLEARQDRIADDLEQASKLRDEAAVAIATYEAALAEARSEAQAMTTAAREKAAAEAAQENARLKDKLWRQVALAEERIAAAKDEAVANLRQAAGEAARAAIAKLIGLDIDEAAAARAVAAELEGEG